MRTIRELEERDADAVEKIFDLYWNDDFRKSLSKRLKAYLDKEPESIQNEYKYFVMEEDGEVVGVTAMRKAPAFMLQFATTEKPVEFYVSAVKEKGKGIGTLMRDKKIEAARELGYTEALFYSGETHQDSWAFHDDSDFKRVGPAVAPNGEPGMIWRMML